MHFKKIHWLQTLYAQEEALLLAVHFKCAWNKMQTKTMKSKKFLDRTVPINSTPIYHTLLYAIYQKGLA